MNLNKNRSDSDNSSINKLENMRLSQGRHVQYNTEEKNQKHK